jgi:site-specific recombinase XerC
MAFRQWAGRDQHILGHDNLDVTAHYAQVSTRLMMQIYNQAHPHART